MSQYRYSGWGVIFLGVCVGLTCCCGLLIGLSYLPLNIQILEPFLVPLWYGLMIGGACSLLLAAAVLQTREIIVTERQQSVFNEVVPSRVEFIKRGTELRASTDCRLVKRDFHSISMSNLLEYFMTPIDGNEPYEKMMLLNQLLFKAQYQSHCLTDSGTPLEQGCYEVSLAGNVTVGARHVDLDTRAHHRLILDTTQKTPFLDINPSGEVGGEHYAVHLCGGFDYPVLKARVIGSPNPYTYLRIKFVQYSAERIQAIKRLKQGLGEQGIHDYLIMIFHKEKWPAQHAQLTIEVIEAVNGFLSDYIPGKPGSKTARREALFEWLMQTLVMHKTFGDNKVVYPDWKPSNICLRNSSLGKRIILSDTKTLYCRGEDHSKTVLTPAYAAPEAALDQGVVQNEQYDGYLGGLYAIGVSAVELLTGCPDVAAYQARGANGGRAQADDLSCLVDALLIINPEERGEVARRLIKKYQQRCARQFRTASGRGQTHLSVPGQTQVVPAHTVTEPAVVPSYC